MKIIAKKTLAWLLSVLLIVGCCLVAGVPRDKVSAQTSGDFVYTVLEDGTAEITDYTGWDPDLEIPAELDGYVISRIGDEAFENCISLGEITIPDSVISIGNSAFSMCTGLMEIAIPDSVTSIGENIFESCLRLTTISVSENNLVYSSQDGVLFNKARDELIRCPQGKKGSYTIPDSVTIIGDFAFSGCINLSEIILSDSVTVIGDGAFNSCDRLSEITLPDCITSVGDRAFYDCTRLSRMIIPASVTSIGNQAIGYYYRYSDNQEVLQDGFTIYGYENTVAETYANENGISFQTLNNATGLPFADVAASGVYYTNAVQYVFQNGLMTGMNATTFGPSQTLSRAQFAVILYRMAGSPSVAGMDNPFADNQQGMFYHDAVIWCNNVGIITGYYNADGSFTGRFGPSDRITREQLATMLYRYANYAEMDTSASISLDDFGDGSRVSAFAAQALQWAAAEGIVSGRQTDPPTIAPQDSASRADTAVMLQRFLV